MFSVKCTRIISTNSTQQWPRNTTSKFNRLLLIPMPNFLTKLFKTSSVILQKNPTNGQTKKQTQANNISVAEVIINAAIFNDLLDYGKKINQWWLWMINLYASANNSRRTALCFRVVRPSVRCPFSRPCPSTRISRDAVSLHLVDGFQ